MEPEHQQGQPDDQPEQSPQRIDASSPGAHQGSEEAGLHEKPGSGVTMPGWARSLQQDTSSPQSDLKVDLVERMRQEEAAAAARAKAAREAEERARQEAAQRARATSAAQQQTPRQAGNRAATGKTKRRVSKWPSALAALAVILIGGYVGIEYQRASEEQAAPSPEPSAFVEETPIASPGLADPTAPSEDGVRAYTVQAGDTLESIAERFDETPEEISRVNGGNKRPIEFQPGQVINIP
ncbi:MAG: LysM peptidoglycan-binding domain-containing protein [Patescibacteria group bacterium]